MRSILQVRDLRKIYRGKPPFPAVDGISFDLREREMLGLLGPNGAGKTTTIHMLLGILTYSSGSILYFGNEFHKNRHTILQQVTFASTYVNLPWMLTIDQNLEVFGRLYGLKGAEIRQRSEPLLERFGIAHKRKSKVAALSAGQITRLILVKAFLPRPKIVLLDEPTASLDPDMALEVCAFLREQQTHEGTTMLFTSHKMDEVADLCDRILFLQQGKIIADDLPQNLINTVSHSRLQLVIVDGMKRLENLVQNKLFRYKIEGRWIEIEIEDRLIAPFLIEIAQVGLSYSTIRIDQPNLEDYFLKMVQS